MHIQLEKNVNSVREIGPLKEFLFGVSGNCSVYLHLDISDKQYIVKANAQLSTPNDKEFLQRIKDIPLVKDAWLA